MMEIKVEDSPRSLDSVSTDASWLDKSRPIIYFDCLTEALHNNERACHIDWLRIIANWLVVAVHFIVVVQNMQLEASDGAISTMNSFLVNLLQFGMPAFFYAAGRSAAFNSKRDLRSFCEKKIWRLSIPLVVGYFSIVIPTAYISGPFWSCRHLNPPENAGFLEFYSWNLRNFSGCGVEWLWFLPLLLCISIAVFPFSVWVTTLQLVCSDPKYLTARDQQHRSALLGVFEEAGYGRLRDIIYCRPMLSATIKMIGNTALFALAAFYFGRTVYGLSWEILRVCILPFVITPVWLAVTLPISRMWNWRQLMFLVLPVGTVIMAAYKREALDQIATAGKVDSAVGRIAISVPYYLAFYMQGIMEQRYMFEWECYERFAISVRDRITIDWLLRPLSTLFWVAFLANGTPGVTKYWGYLWTYPVYQESYTAVSYVIGSWIGVHVWERFLSVHLRSQIHPLLHKHMTTMSLMLYVVHGFLIAVVARIIIWPRRESIGAIQGILILAATVSPFTIILYFILINIPPAAAVFGVADGHHRWGEPARDLYTWFKKKSEQHLDSEISP